MRPKRHSIDESSSLTAVPFNDRNFMSFIGSKISGKSSNSEQPVRSSSGRDFNLQMVGGRCANLLQFVSSIVMRPKRHSIDEGSSLMAVPFNDRMFRCPIGSNISGKSSNSEQPVRSSS
ncbi:hypothetical protein L3X38_043702 [Prunus dulcis]|uniref:Uncharacterized protein n=1 Tax=Prunus dulcis TaxID=3755 RepID=A0AAD4YMF1_PRUDU|nr:hypothetical protein L3X38_043702 [Prunus dulcis]